MKKIDGPTNPAMVKKYNISSYPTLVLVKGTKEEVYKGDKTIKGLRKFLS